MRIFEEVLPPPSPCSGELRTQKLKSHLFRTQSSIVLPLKPGVGQYIQPYMPRLLPRISSLLISTLPVHSPAFFFSKTSPEFFVCQLWLTPVPAQACRIKSVTLLDAGSRVECSRNINTLQNICYCFSGFGFQNCEQNLTCGLREKDLWYNDLWNE